MAETVNMSGYRMCWHDSTRFDTVADMTSRNRFDTMISHLHTNDSSTMKAPDEPEYYKSFKVRPFVDSIKSVFRETEVEDDNSVHELIIAFNRRSSLKQYVRNKPPQMMNKSIYSNWFQ
jgi:hypothetical protein